MKLLFYAGDLHRTTTASHGIFNYALSLAEHLPEYFEPDDIGVLVASQDFLSEMSTVSSAWRVKLLPRPLSQRQRLLNDHWHLPRFVRRETPDVVQLPKGILPLVAPKTFWVATVHDDIPFHYANGRYGARSRRKNAAVWRLIARAGSLADLVITDSVHYARVLHLRHGFKAPIVPIALAPGVRSRCYVPLAERSRKIVSFGQNFPHKRPHIIERCLLTEGSTLAEEGLTHEIITDLKSRQEVEDRLAIARCLVVAAEIEGFGLPALEAVTLGVPVVVADTPVAREVVGRWAHFFDASKRGTFGPALTRALSRSDEWLQHSAEEAKAFYTWSKTAHAHYRAVKYFWATSSLERHA